MDHQRQFQHTSLSLTSLRFSSTLTLLCRSTQPGFTSGWATYTLNLHGRACRSTATRSIMAWSIAAEHDDQCLASSLTHSSTSKFHCIPNLILRIIAELKRGVETSGDSRIEGNKNSLVEDHGGIAAGDADLAVWCSAIHNLCGSHVAGREGCPTIKPDPCPHAYEESSCYEVVLNAAVSVVRPFLWATRRCVWGARRWPRRPCNNKPNNTDDIRLNRQKSQARNFSFFQRQEACSEWRLGKRATWRWGKVIIVLRLRSSSLVCRGCSPASVAFFLITFVFVARADGHHTLA